MARARTENSEGFGTDSFLDIVCNMVGIIILLVLVMGLRVKEGPISLAAETAPLVAESEPEPAAPAAEHASAEPQSSKAPSPELRAIESEIDRGRAAIIGAEQDRRTLEQRLFAARQATATREQEIKQLREQLAGAEQWQTQMQKDLLAKQEQLRLLASAVQAVPGAKPAKTVQLEAYPAPFLKQVDTKEAHFRILGGRVVYMPVDELMVKAKIDAEVKMEQTPGSTEIESQVGPIQGFTVSYVLRRHDGRVDDYWFTFISESVHIGETTAEALAPSSQFRSILLRVSKDPRITTITFQVYQDSFEAFRQLRKEVYLLGFNVANWPRKLGDHIRFVKYGRHSETQ
jgi:hypothetical protein